MERFVELARGIFVQALSYEDVPGYERPLLLRLFSWKNHAAELPILRKLAERHKDGPFLKEAYEIKLRIPQFTEDKIDSPQAMQALMRTVHDSMDELET